MYLWPRYFWIVHFQSEETCRSSVYATVFEEVGRGTKASTERPTSIIDIGSFLLDHLKGGRPRITSLMWYKLIRVLGRFGDVKILTRKIFSLKCQNLWIIHSDRSNSMHWGNCLSQHHVRPSFCFWFLRTRCGELKREVSPAWVVRKLRAGPIENVTRVEENNKTLS